MNKITTRPDQGQALLELCVAAPLILSLLVALSVTLGLGWIQLEVSALTQEFGVCLLQKKQNLYCRNSYRQALTRLPGSFQILSFRQYRGHVEVNLRHHLPLLKPEWKFHEPVQSY